MYYSQRTIVISLNNSNTFLAPVTLKVYNIIFHVIFVIDMQSVFFTLRTLV